MTTKNPWRGLASYEEPQGTSDDYLFCGRDEETLDVVRLIDNNLFITLYGSSGIGKSSLLKAGVMPILRRKDYFPLYIRLTQEPKELSYAETIIRKLQNSGLKEERSIALEHSDGSDRLFLWNYFATTRFFNAEDREVYPVVILDQFEEVFRDADKRKAESLLQQIYLLLNDELEMPDQDGYSADTNYRFVASIREDFLFVLEDSIDENSLDLYKNNRYRLRPMKPENARQVVLVPGKNCIEESEKASVADRVVSLAKRNEKDDIDTLLLSLVCAGTFDKKAGEKISISDLSVWKDNPMEVYYQDAIKDLTAKQIRYIQQHLIREDGSRKRMDAKEVKAALGESTYNALTQGENRMLVLGEHGQVELLHDQLALAVFEDRKAFEEKERKKKLKRRIWLIGTAVFFLVLFFAIFSVIVAEQRQDLLRNQSRFVAEKASSLVEAGDSYLARLLALAVLPDNVSQKDKLSDKVFTPEAEIALREAVSHNTAILHGKSAFISAFYSPDGKQIVSTIDSAVIVWDAETGKELMTIKGHHSDVYYATYSPDGSSIVSTSWGDTIRLWDACTGKVIFNLTEEANFSYCVNFSSDGKHIVSADSFGHICIWDTKTGAELQSIQVTADTELEDIFNSVFHVAFSPDGKRIVSSSRDKTIRIWDVETGKELRRFTGHSDEISCALFSPDGKQILSASADGTIRLWDAESGNESRISDGNSDGKKDGVQFAAFSCDGKRIAAGLGNSVIIWDAESGETMATLEGHSSSVNTVAFSPNGKHIVSASMDNTIRIWDIDSVSGNITIDIDSNSSRWNYSTRHTAISPDGKLIAHSSGEAFWLIDIESREIIASNNNRFKSIEFSPDGKHIVTISKLNVGIMDVESGTMKELKDKLNAKSAVFSPNGEKIAIATIVAGGEQKVLVYDVESGTLEKTLDGHSSMISSVAYSPDGKRLVTASSDKNIIIWNAKTGTPLHTLTGHTNSVQSAKYSLDGKRIVSSSYDQTVRIWDALLGKEIKTLAGHTSMVLCAAFSPDGDYIVSASADKTVRVWDAYTGKQIKVFEGHTDYVHFAAFTPDGKHIVSASSDGTIRIWDFPPLQDLIDQTRERFKDRPLTPEERRQYYLE